MTLTVKIALAATLALGLIAVPAAAKPATSKVDTKMVIEGYNFHMSSGRVVFKGHVECASKCLGGRKVTLKQTTDHIKAGTDKTNSKGDWKVSFKAVKIDPGVFKATAAKRVVVKKRHGHVVKKTVCKAGRSKGFDATQPPAL